MAENNNVMKSVYIMGGLRTPIGVTVKIQDGLIYIDTPMV